MAAGMDGQLDQETKDRRAELVMQIQTGIMAQKQAEKVGKTLRVLCDGIDEGRAACTCAAPPRMPGVDGNVCVNSFGTAVPRRVLRCVDQDSDLYDLYGTVVKITNRTERRRFYESAQ